ncbi:MAG: 4-hydroxy-tetrahydrodipicolinate reductase [Actinobacteria bacterium]|nr:4-hydroxy-tetrahydrodipicolinate reductase [Actinomycetota bacterium]
MIRVSVLGALGRMGREVIKAVEGDNELELSCLIDPWASGIEQSKRECMPAELVESVTSAVPESMDVIVDFTNAAAAVENILWALDNGVHAVVGTSGIKGEELSLFEAKSGESGANVIIAPNFAIGAVLMMKFARTAARVFNECEIIEFHHRGKKDAPSGTAIETAKQVEGVIAEKKPPASEQRIVEGTRGGNIGSVQIHSVRLDGYAAHQEVVFGGPGQTLSIRHDTIDRTCYMPGVLIAVKAVAERAGVTVGLEPLLGID